MERENNIIITLKDIFNVEGISYNLAQAISEKLVENKFFDKERDEDSQEIYNTLKPQIKEELKDLCSQLIKEEMEKILKDRYEIRTMVRATLTQYMNNILNSKIEGIKDEQIYF